MINTKYTKLVKQLVDPEYQQLVLNILNSEVKQETYFDIHGRAHRINTPQQDAAVTRARTKLYRLLGKKYGDTRERTLAHIELGKIMIEIKKLVEEQDE